MTSHGSQSVLLVLSWLQTAFHVAIAIAFAIFCFVRARRIGAAGASLLAGVALVDAAGVVIYRLTMAVLTSTHASSSTFDGVFTTLGAMNIFFDLISVGLVGGAFFLLRSAPLPAR